MIDDGIVIEFSQKAPVKLPAGTVINYAKDKNGRVAFEELYQPVKTPKKRLVIKREKGDFSQRVPKKSG